MKPVWLITYENVDISDEIAPMVLSAEYTDRLEGASDELQLTLEDRVGRWREGWWPSEGDTISVQMGYQGQTLLDAGTFRVDEVSLRGPPDTVGVGAQAAPKTAAMRTTQHRAFEGLTLRELVERLASELELTVTGSVAELALERVTQSGETTLAFLRRTAKAYGYAFSIRPPQLVFYRIVDLESEPGALTLDRTDLGSYDFKGSTQETYVACEVSYLDPRTKGVRQARVEAAFARRAIVIAPSKSESGDDPNIVIPTRTLRLLSPYQTGDDVLSWQTWVQSYGVDPGPLDGIFGPLTRRGTVIAQQKLGAEPDGAVGPETRRLAQEAGWGKQTKSSVSAAQNEPSGRVLRKDLRLESQEQALLRAQALLLEANRLRVTGNLGVTGSPQLVAGTTIELTGMGRVSGKYLVQTSTHRVSRSGGYATTAEVTCV